MPLLSKIVELLGVLADQCRVHIEDCFLLSSLELPRLRLSDAAIKSAMHDELAEYLSYIL